MRIGHSLKRHVELKPASAGFPEGLLDQPFTAGERRSQKRSGQLLFVASTYLPDLQSSIDIFRLTAGLVTEILTPGMVSTILPDALEMHYPLITDAGIVYAGVHRKSGPIGLTASLALIERNLTGTKVIAREGDPAPAGGSFRSIPGGQGFRAVTSTASEVYTTWGTSRAGLPSSVSPNTQVTFTFTVTAPSTPGTYNFHTSLRKFPPLTGLVALKFGRM